MKSLFKILSFYLMMSKTWASLSEADKWLKSKKLNEYGDPEGEQL